MFARRGALVGLMLSRGLLMSGCASNPATPQIPTIAPRPMEGLVLVSPEVSAPPEWVRKPPAPTDQVRYFVGIAEQSRQESVARNVAFADALGQIPATLAADVTQAIRVAVEEQPDLAGGVDLNALQFQVTDVFAATRVAGTRQEDMYVERYAYMRNGEAQYYVYKVYMLVALDREAYDRALQTGVQQLKAQAQKGRKAELERLYDEVMMRRALEHR